jgi:uncharacterized BrkB/YihY/UPF0761 family membrane protein
MAAAVAAAVFVLVVAILLVVRKCISRKNAIHDGEEAADAWKVLFFAIKTILVLVLLAVVMSTARYLICSWFFELGRASPPAVTVQIVVRLR